MNSLLKRFAFVLAFLSAAAGIQAEPRLSEVLPKMPVSIVSYPQVTVVGAALAVGLISAGLSLGGFANLMCCTKPTNPNRTRTPYPFEEYPLICFIAGAISTWGCFTLASTKFQELAEAINADHVNSPDFAAGIKKNLATVLAITCQDTNAALGNAAAAKIISSTPSISATPAAAVSNDAFRFTPPAPASSNVSGMQLRITK